MTTTTPLADSMTMLRRNILHMIRYPSVTLSAIVMPAIMLILFGHVFGDALGAGLGPAAGRANYLDYQTPGMIALTVAL